MEDKGEKALIPFYCHLLQEAAFKELICVLEG